MQRAQKSLVLVALAVALCCLAYVHYTSLHISNVPLSERTTQRLELSGQLKPAELPQLSSRLNSAHSKTAHTPEKTLTVSPEKPDDLPQAPKLTTTNSTLATPSPDAVAVSDHFMQVLPESAPEEDILQQIRKYTNSLPNTTEVSVVTAYFNLGPLNKKSSEGRYTPDLYKRWMSIFGWLDNPLVVFADSQDTATYFRQLRARYPPSRTKIILLQRKQLWAFRLEGKIKQIYAQKGYPRHSPNTINPLYSCAMHAKFELVQKMIREGLYQTRHVAWLDIGLFRAEAKKNKTIHLTVPRDFNRWKVGYSQVSKFLTLTPQSIIRQNRVWVGGASFLATPEVAYVYCSDYRRAVRKLLDMKWISTDQQVIYSMFQPSFNFTRRFQLQAYTRHIENSWFSMGYLMKVAP